MKEYSCLWGHQFNEDEVDDWIKERPLCPICLKDKKNNEERAMRHKLLNEYTNEELIGILDNNNKEQMSELGAICSEILRRLNDIKPLFEEVQKEEGK